MHTCGESKAQSGLAPILKVDSSEPPSPGDRLHFICEHVPEQLPTQLFRYVSMCWVQKSSACLVPPANTALPLVKQLRPEEEAHQGIQLDLCASLMNMPALANHSETCMQVVRRDGLRVGSSRLLVLDARTGTANPEEIQRRIPT